MHSTMAVFAQTLRFARNGMLGYAVGLAATAYVTVLFFPAVEAGMADFERLLQSLPPELMGLFGMAGGIDLGTPAGYLFANLFAFFVPWVLILQAVYLGAHAVAGEEERHTLEQVMAQPISRVDFFLAKLGAVKFALAASAVSLFLGTWIGAVQVGMDLDPGKLAAACLSVWTLALLFGTVALAIGSAFGRPGLAVGLSTGLAGISYLWNALVPLAERLEGLADLSPFYHGVGYGPLEHGFRAAPLLILLGLGLLVAAYGLARFVQRDLGT